MFMDWACACDGLFPLPVEEKAIMESDKHELLRPRAVMRDTAKGALVPDWHTDRSESTCLRWPFRPLQAAQDNGRPLPNRLFHLPDAEKVIYLHSRSYKPFQALLDHARQSDKDTFP